MEKCDKRIPFPGVMTWEMDMGTLYLTRMRALRWTASAIALSFSGTAYAQAVEYPQEAEEEVIETPAGIDTIVVTAQKVEQDVQDVPIAISAFTGEQLQAKGVDSIEDLAVIAPSVSFRKGTTSANSAIVMRGVGTISFSIAAEPSVSTVVDGIVLSRSGQAFMDLVDLERLEVLRAVRRAPCSARTRRPASSTSFRAAAATLSRARCARKPIPTKNIASGAPWPARWRPISARV